MDKHLNKQFLNAFAAAAHPNRARLPNIEEPKPIGFYSINADRDFEPNDQQLRYFRVPKKFPLDLNVGLNIAIQKPESAYDEGIDHLLKFVSDHNDTIFNNSNGTAPPEFITSRGNLRSIMCAPYELQQNLCLHVSRFGNVIYLMKKETPLAKCLRRRNKEYQRKFTAYSYKFEQYCLSESLIRDPDTSAPVNECEEFALVYQTRLADVNLLYSAETDGIVSDMPVQLNYANPSQLSSLKCVKVYVHRCALNTFEYQNFLKQKIRNWWCRCFMAGIKDIYLGRTNQEGIVDKIQHLNVESLPELHGQTYWSPSVCVNFLVDFLVRLRSIMANENCPYTVYELYFDNQTGEIQYKCFRGKTEHSFIPDWYINFINNKKGKLRLTS